MLFLLIHSIFGFTDSYVLPKALFQNCTSQYALELAGLSENPSKNEKPNMRCQRVD